MKTILGLDLGTNSIGWALIQQDFNKKEGEIIGMGCRIIPMSQDILGKFDSGVSLSQTAERTGYRGVRRLRERHLLRRERLHRILNILGFLPQHYAKKIDFVNKKGQYINNQEVKLNYRKNDDGKFEFIFMDSFTEMAELFKNKGYEDNLPFDWTLYFLRKKALMQKITKEELAWVILNFNQKRGYYQLRGEEEEETEGKSKTFEQLYVKEVVDSGEKIKKTDESLYDIYFENDWKYDRQTTKPEDWLGKTKEFIVTTSTLKDGTIRRTFKSVDSEKDWIAIKKKTEQDLDNSNKHVGAYIFDTLLDNPKQKINGQLIKTIERKYYKNELKEILNKQKELHPELQSEDLYQEAINELYPKNKAHQQNIKDNDFTYLFLEDIIFYHRPLKSKKSTISDCSYETKQFMRDGEKVEKAYKCIPKSNPLFQEFRLWQFIQNLKICKKQGLASDGQIEINQDVTKTLLPDDYAVASLFDFLNNRKEIEQKQLLKYFSDLKLIPKQSTNDPEYFWNYVQDRKYPCNETKALIVSKLSQVDDVNVDEFLNKEKERQLWHIIYSVKDKNEFIKALGTFAGKNNISKEEFVEVFKKTPPFANDYGAYSAKAIKKLLPVMRMGHYWKENKIGSKTKERIEDIINRLKYIDFNKEKLEEVADDQIPRALLKSFIPFEEKNPLTGLNTYQACYAVYGRHSELSEVSQWKSPKDIEHYLNNVFKQHQLRNPIVEQVCTETLRLVKKIWEYYGNGENNFFDEIHVELGREMKNPADKRKRMTDQNTERENTNHRIERILEELAIDSSMEVKPRPYSPSHQEILKIYEDGIFNSKYEVEDEILNIRKTAKPTKAQIIKYKLWLEQGYISPYTLKLIPLSKLFTRAYDIEHIIPQSRFFDNSLNNKIICESVINEEKGNATAYEFIKARGGESFDLGKNNIVPLVKYDVYENHCNQYFKKNRIKLRNLFADEIPTSFIERQLNDSRYISKFVKGLLSNIVREDGENQATSKNLVPVNGIITSRLRHDWGLNDKWNELVSPRFKRLNEMLNSNDFGFWDKNINAFRIQVPDDISKGFSSKRIDHRHHALDALVVACTTKDHVNYVTSINTERHNYALVSKLRETESILRKDPLTGIIKEARVAKSFKQPWDGFPVEVKQSLENVVVSFKKNLRVINRTNNKYQKWEKQSNGEYKKVLVQQRGKNFAIRKPMHKETVSGRVNIKQVKGSVTLNYALQDWELIVDDRIKSQVKKLFKKYHGDLKKIRKYLKQKPIKIDDKEIKKVKVYEIVEATATRVALTDKLTQKQLDSITDSGIRKILQKHVNQFKDEKGKLKFDQAFSPEGIEQMNANIIELNGGKFHHPIYKVRIYEVGNKFAVGETGNKTEKFVEAAKGTNLFFAIYWDEENQKRVYETVPLNEVIAHQKEFSHVPNAEKTPIPLKSENGTFLFFLSPNDLVYVPTDEEIENPELFDVKKLNSEQINRIYKFVSCSGSQGFFIKSEVAVPIFNKVEFSALNKMERDINGNMVKDRCWKITTDRLGNITKVLK